MKPIHIALVAALALAGFLGVMLYQAKQVQPAATPAETAAVTPSPTPAPAVEPAPAPAVREEPQKPSPAPVRKKAQPKAEERKPVETAQATPPPAAQPTAPAPESKQAPAVSQPAAPPPRREPRTVTIPAGTLVTVRLGEALSSDKNQPGDSFVANIDQPLVVEGMVIAERGAKVEGRVIEAEKAGRVRGVSSLSIHLVRLHTSDGQRVELHTEPFAKHGPTSKKEDAAKVGAGAGIGAAIGAIAGGGKGAAIGAAIGGATGAGTVAATRGKPAEIENETRLSFKLENAVTLTEKLK